MAAALGDVDMVRALVEAGADVNETAEHGFGRDLPALPFLSTSASGAGNGTRALLSERLLEARRAQLPPHVKMEIVQPKRRNK